MKDWNKLLEEKSSRTDKPIKPQVVAKAVSDELEDNAIISVDCGTNRLGLLRYINIRKGMKFSLSGTFIKYGKRSTICNISPDCLS